MPGASRNDITQNRSKIQTTISPDDEEIQQLLWAHGIYNRRTMGMYRAFSRIPVIDVDNALINAREYVFFTKPDLHILNLNSGGVASALSNNSFFVDVASRYKDVCYQLQSSASRRSNATNGGNNPFMTILSNSIRSELTVPDSESDTDVDTGVNDYGTKITYRGTSYTSDQEHSFFIEFEDTKYLEVFMLFKIYDEYEKLKNLGLIELGKSSDDDRWINYTLKKILHDQFSIYKFIVGEDGETILYYGMYTGVFPTGAPRDSFSRIENSQTGQAITVNFKAQFYRDMDPSVLGSFNRLIDAAFGSGGSGRYLPLFNTTTHRFEGKWATTPYVVVNRSAGSVGSMTQYKLRWRE